MVVLHLVPKVIPLGPVLEMVAQQRLVRLTVALETMLGLALAARTCLLEELPKLGLRLAVVGEAQQSVAS